MSKADSKSDSKSKEEQTSDLSRDITTELISKSTIDQKKQSDTSSGLKIKRLKCVCCGLIFTTIESRVHHIENDPICKKYFIQEKTHCDNCNKDYESNKAYRLHYSNKHGNKEKPVGIVEKKTSKKLVQVHDTNKYTWMYKNDIVKKMVPVFLSSDDDKILMSLGEIDQFITNLITECDEKNNIMDERDDLINVIEDFHSKILNISKKKKGNDA